MTQSIETFFGDGSLGQPMVDANIFLGNGRVQSFRFISAGLALTLPDARDFNHTGGPIFILFNVGPHAFDLEDNTGALVGSIPAAMSTHVLLSDNTTQGGRWHIDTGTYTATGSATPSSTPSATPSASPEPSVSNTFSGTAFPGSEFSGSLIAPPA